MHFIAFEFHEKELLQTNAKLVIEITLGGCKNYISMLLQSFSGKRIEKYIFFILSDIFFFHHCVPLGGLH